MPKIAIIGAGINGLTLAIALRQLGFLPDEIEIFEKAEHARAEGTGIIFWAEVVSVLKQIGVDLTQAGVCLPKSKTFFLTESDSPISFDMEKKKGEEAYGFLREKIYTVLLDKIKECGLTIKTGFECIDIVQKSDCCDIFFKNQNQPIRADVVIGCDGIYSNVRNLISPTVQPEALNIRAYRGTFHAKLTDRDMLALPKEAFHLYCGPNYRILIYPNFDDTKNNQTSYYWFAAHRVDPSECKTRPSVEVTDTEIETLIKNMPLCPSNIQNLIKQTPHDQIIASSTLRQLPFSSCHQDRIALLGDAIHAMAPTAGLGVLLGIINALHLAANLKQHEHNLPFALQEYGSAVAEHSKACLAYTDKLTTLFYVEHPLSTAKVTQGLYAELYQLTAEAASKSQILFEEIMTSRNAAATCLQSVFRGYLTRKNIEQESKLEEAPSLTMASKNKVSI